MICAVAASCTDTTNENRAKVSNNVRKTIVFDFDGVIHSYSSGWQGVTVIPDAPIEETVETIKRLRKEDYEIVVVSTRCANLEGMLAVRQYLKHHKIEVDRVCSEKPPALVYVDDRAVCFRPGTDLYNQIINFKPWREKDEAQEAKPQQLTCPYPLTRNPHVIYWEQHKCPHFDTEWKIGNSPCYHYDHGNCTRKRRRR